MSSPHCGLLFATLLFLSLFVFSCGAEQESTSVGFWRDPKTFLWNLMQKALEVLYKKVKDNLNVLYKKVTDNLVTVGNFTTSAYQKVETSIYNAVNKSSFVHQLVEIFQEATGTI